MIIYFLRHASAGQHFVDPKKDNKRPLDSDGIRQCGYVGRACSSMNIQVDLIISSGLKRALQTGGLVGTELGYEGKILVDAALLPAADYTKFRELIAKHSRLDAVMVVGHNPSLTEFLSRLISLRSGKAEVDLKKGALAKVDVEGKQATLQWLLTPRIIKSIHDSATPKSRPKTSRK